MKTLMAAVMAAGFGAAAPQAPKSEAPKTQDPCRYVSIHLDVARQDSLEDEPPSIVDDQNGPWLQVVVFEGEPAVVGLGVLRAHFRPPEGGVTVNLLQNAKVVSTVRFEKWTRSVQRVSQHSEPGNPEEFSFASEMKTVTFDPGPPGVYSLTAVPEGCDSGKHNYIIQAIRLEVRAISSPRDRAEVLQYHAKNAFYEAKDCAAVLKAVASVEAIVPDEDAPMRLRALCAEKGGDLKTALEYYLRLEARFEEKRRKSSGLHEGSPGAYTAKISELRAKARAAEEAKRKAPKPVP